MKETIVLAPGAKENELLGSLARYGKNKFGMRVCGGADLARLALMRSGVPVIEDFISTQEENVLIAEAIKGVEYFRNTTYSDVENVARALRTARRLVAGEDEAEVLSEKFNTDKFRAKNTALFNVYHNYINLMEQKGVIDTTALIRKAAMQSEQLSASFVTLDEYPLSPLEQALLNRLSGGCSTAMKLRDLFDAEEKPLAIRSYKNCYGAPNEVESILEDIYSGKRLDECSVAVTDTATYGQSNSLEVW